MTVRPPSPFEPAQVPVDFARLPVPALYTRELRVVAVNAAYEAFMLVRAEEVVGESFESLVSRFVLAEDIPMVGGASDDLRAGTADDGTIWCTVTDGTGRVRPIRVRWEPCPDGVGTIVFLLDAEGDTRDKQFSEALARAGGELVSCRDERAVLERAADTLAAQGLTVTVLLIVPNDPLLEYGPIRGAPSRANTFAARTGERIQAHRPPRSVLTDFNPGFPERRAAFFQEVAQLVRRAYPQAVADALIADLPGRHLVQAPLFVEGVAYGALVVTGDVLTPSRAGTIEMFAELVVRAIENVRLHEVAARRVAELERLQTVLVERERLAALGEAAAVMAHEVRNPISAILNAVAVMRRVDAGGVESVEMMRVIQEEALRLERLVRDLLDLGRPLLPRCVSVDLFELTRSSVGLLQDRRECDDIVFELGADPGSTSVDVDPDLVQLAVLNIARNAAQASPPGGRVRVAVDHVSAGVRISVEDSGPGMDADVARRAFEPFFTTRPAGTGIGLAVVRRVVEVHGGEVRVSRGEGRGSRVELVFPYTRP